MPYENNCAAVLSVVDCCVVMLQGFLRQLFKCGRGFWLLLC